MPNEKTYCMKCQKLTGNTSVKYVMQDGRKRMKSICSVCKKPKSMFVSTNKQSGKGIVDKFIENLPIELHLLGTYHPESYQSGDTSLKGVKPGKTLKAEFLGPGTKYDMRYARGDWGINNLDHAAMSHDLAYKSKDSGVRNRADERLIDAANNYLKEPNLTFLDKVDVGIVKTAMRLIKRKV